MVNKSLFLTLVIFFVRLYFRKNQLWVILGERCKLPSRVLGRAPNADDYGRFLMNWILIIIWCYKHVLMTQMLISASGWGSGDPRFQSDPRLITHAILFTLPAINQSSNQLGEWSRVRIDLRNRNSDRQSDTWGVSNDGLWNFSPTPPFTTE